MCASIHIHTYIPVAGHRHVSERFRIAGAVYEYVCVCQYITTCIVKMNINLRLQFGREQSTPRKLRSQAKVRTIRHVTRLMNRSTSHLYHYNRQVADIRGCLAHMAITRVAPHPTSPPSRPRRQRGPLPPPPRLPRRPRHRPPVPADAKRR